MSNNAWDLEDLGDTIEAIIDQAVSSQNYQKLNQTIRQVVNAAVDTGSEAIRRAVDEGARNSGSRPKIVEERDDSRDARRQVRQAVRSVRQQVRSGYQPNVNIYSSRLGSSRAQQEAAKTNLPVLYQNTSGKMAGGIMKTVGGGILTFFGSGGLLATSIVAAVSTLGFGIIPAVISAAGVGVGSWLLGSGIHTIGKMNRFEKYVKALGEKTYCDLTQLSRYVGKPTKFVRKELKGMIDEGLFLEGHLDDTETSLITSNDTFVHYLETQRNAAVRKQQEVVEAKQEADRKDAQKVSAQVQEVLDKGNAFIRQIRQCNDAIPGVEISEKISRMEMLVRKIFDRVKSHPEVVPDLKKLMDYYLPMTVKLLNAYADMDAQPIQGENIQNSKREIEATLDTLNTAFEKLLDSIFKDVALDVSSDISVLQTLLAQEGLTDDELTQMRKGNLS